MGDSYAFANRGTLYIVGTTGGVPVSAAVGVIKDVELTMSSEHVPLYGWGSILRVAVAKHTHKVQVKFGAMKINNTLTATPAWWTYTHHTTSGGGTIEDTNAVKLFDIEAVFTFEDGTYLKGTVSSVYFPTIPFRASEGQWVKQDVTGEGKSVVWANTAHS